MATTTNPPAKDAATLIDVQDIVKEFGSVIRSRREEE